MQSDVLRAPYYKDCRMEFLNMLKDVIFIKEGNSFFFLYWYHPVYGGSYPDEEVIDHLVLNHGWRITGDPKESGFELCRYTYGSSLDVTVFHSLFFPTEFHRRTNKVFIATLIDLKAMYQSEYEESSYDVGREFDTHFCNQVDIAKISVASVVDIPTEEFDGAEILSLYHEDLEDDEILSMASHAAFSRSSFLSSQVHKKR
ncbi:MAG: hypothetical protein GY861_21790 [bacterium]|nr:hypothetical protein [bacterium]